MVAHSYSIQEAEAGGLPGLQRVQLAFPPQIIEDFSDTRALSSKHGAIHWPPGPGKNRGTSL